MQLPQFHIEDFTPVISRHLDVITAQQWEDIKYGDIKEGILKTLDDMLSDLEQVCISTIKGGAHPCAEEEASSLPDSPVFSGVTCADVQASLGDSLHHCFGAALNLEQSWSHNSEHVTKFLAEVVAKALNGCQSEDAAVQDSEDSMSVSLDRGFSLFNLGYILKRVMNKGPTFQRLPPIQEEEASLPDILISERPVDTDILDHQKVFVSIFFHKLVDHIARVTNTMVLDVNFVWLVEQLRERTVGQLGSYLPDHVGDLHVRIYKDLRWDFGGSMKLYCAIFNDTEVFLDTVASELKAELQRMSKKGAKKSKKSEKKAQKLKGFFHRLLRRDRGASPEEPKTSDPGTKSEKQESKPGRRFKHRVIRLDLIARRINRFF